jgi:large subunit ribosomal protein L24
VERIRRGDTVYVIKGKDRGKTGKVLSVLRLKGRAIVEGINLAKKHMRRRTQEQQAGIVNVEMPISISNLMLFCKRCNGPVRVGFSILADGKKSRFCKVCKEII